jgi:DNA-binding transcriptional LysR family regulator
MLGRRGGLDFQARSVARRAEGKTMDRVTSMAAFAKVVTTGGFSAAGRALNMSPSMVSNHVQSLEDRLGVRLLNRSTRKTSLTEVGEAYYERTLQILAELEEAECAAQALQSIPRGSLRLNASVAMPPLLAGVIAEFVRLYPEVSVSMCMTDHLVDLVEERFDLAVSHMPIEESSFISRRVASFRFAVCGSAGYFDAWGVPQIPSDLTRHNCLTYSYSAWGDEWRFSSRDGEQAIRVFGNLQANSANALRSAAVHGQGLVILPMFLVADELRTGRLIHVLGGFLQTEYAVSAIYPHRNRVSAKVRSFIDLLVKHFCHVSEQAEIAMRAA